MWESLDPRFKISWLHCQRTIAAMEVRKREMGFIILSALRKQLNNLFAYLASFFLFLFAVFDYQFTAPDGNVMNKLVFVNWAPETAKVKARMMYASTKDFFKSHMDGISAEFQTSSLEDISEEIVADAVKALKR